MTGLIYNANRHATMPEQDGIIMKTICVVLTVALAGCAAQPAQPSPQASAYAAYVQQNKALVEAGQMKWSEYFKTLYELGMAANAPAAHQLRMSGMIARAQELERGSLSMDAFMAFRREAQVADQADFQERNRQSAAAAEARRQAGLEYLANLRPYQPVVTTVAPLPTIGAGGVTAFFTGKQTSVQTVTNQYGWACEYNYAGRTFTRTFVGICPQSVQVQ